MSTRSKQEQRRNSRQDDLDDGDVFTLSGYKAVFGECKNTSDVLGCLVGKREVDEISFDVWMGNLKEKHLYEPVKHLFDYWTHSCTELEFKDKKTLIKFAELFSLAENVLRNTLLQPYIPAYRTINMDCGRYITSISTAGEELFKVLNFSSDSKNLLTYQEKDSKRTVLYAHTCSVFWHILSMWSRR